MATPPDGKYYCAAFPFVSATLAITCGTSDERRLFWAPNSPSDFCHIRYGLNDTQTAVLLAPTVKFGVTPCHPNNDELDAVLEELEREINHGKPTHGSTAPLDPNLEQRYPTMVALCKALCDRAESAPKHWRRSLKNEWVEFSVPW